MGWACDDNKIIEATRSSIVRISGHTPFGETYICTGFVIQPNIVLTANHCLSPNMSIDGVTADSSNGDSYYDLGIVNVKTGRQSLQLREAPVIMNEVLYGVGYANGWSVPIAIQEVVLIPNYNPFPNGSSGIIGRAGYVHGMSGGPVIDINGLVVSIVQRGQDSLDYGVSVTMMRAFLLSNGITIPITGDLWQN